jgi:hypothetical protein
VPIHAAVNERQKDWLTVAGLVLLAAVGFVAVTTLAVELDLLILFFAAILLAGGFAHLAQRKREQIKHKKLEDFECVVCGRRIERQHEGLGVCEVYIITGYDRPRSKQSHGRFFAHAACLGQAVHNSDALWGELTKLRKPVY